jgi:hypothetical protein
MWSNAGLVAEGAQKFQTGQENLAQEQQQTTEGGIGLTEMQRQVEAAKSLRAATANGGDGIHDIALARAHQQQLNGDMGGFQSSVTEAQNAVQQAKDAMMNGAVYGMDPSKVEEQIKQFMGASAITPGSLKYSQDPTSGHTMVSMIDGKSGQPIPPVDATQYVAMRQPLTTLTPDQKVVRPLTGQTIAENPTAEISRSGGVVMKSGPNAGKIQGQAGIVPSVTKDENGNEITQLYDSGTGKWIDRPGGSAVGTPSQTSPKALAKFKEISTAILNHEGMSSVDQATGGKATTQIGSAKAALGNKLAISNKDLDPQTIAEIAVYGEPRTSPTKGTFVRYQGRDYPFSDAGGQPVSAMGAPGTTATDQAEGTTSNAAVGPVGFKPKHAQPAAQPTPVQAPPVQQPGLEPAFVPDIPAKRAGRDVTPYKARLAALMSTQPPQSAPPAEIADWQAKLVKLQTEQQNGTNFKPKGYARGGKVCSAGLM